MTGIYIWNTCATFFFLESTKKALCLFVSSGSHNLTENVTEDTEEQSDSLPPLQEQGSILECG